MSTCQNSLKTRKNPQNFLSYYRLTKFLSPLLHFFTLVVSSVAVLVAVVVPWPRIPTLSSSAIDGTEDGGGEDDVTSKYT